MRRPASDAEILSYNLSPEARCRHRRYYLMALANHVGLSSRFIADAFGVDDSSVRRILRSETVAVFAFPKLTGHV